MAISADSCVVESIALSRLCLYSPSAICVCVFAVSEALLACVCMCVFAIPGDNSRRWRLQTFVWPDGKSSANCVRIIASIHIQCTITNRSASFLRSPTQIARERESESRTSSCRSSRQRRITSQTISLHIGTITSSSGVQNIIVERASRTSSSTSSVRHSGINGRNPSGPTQQRARH